MMKLIHTVICLLISAALIAASVPAASAETDFYSVAEMLEIKSHIEKDADMGTYATVQGACTDGKYAYFAVQSGTTVILKYNLSTWELRKKVTVSGLGHANDIAYNSKRKCLVVANNSVVDDRLTLLDPDSLKVIDTVVPREKKTEKEIKKEAKNKGVSESEIEKEKDLKVYSIAYNAKRDNYIIGYSGSYDFALMDSDFMVVKRFKGESTGLVRQGCDCDDDHIYFPQGDGSNAIVVYDYSGKKTSMVTLDSFQEVENLFHVGNSFYLTLHHYGNSVQRVGFSKTTQIRFNIRYDAGSGQGKMKNSSVHYGEPTKLRKCTYTKPGYFFGGWSVRRGSDGKYMGFRLGSQKREWLDEEEMNSPVIYGDEGKVSKLVKFGDALLTATWINERYGISFASDGGDGWMAPDSVAYAEEYTMPLNGFVRRGYIFSGFTASREVDGRVYGYRDGSDNPEWLRPSDAERLHYFDEGDKVSKMTYDGILTFTAQFTYAFLFNDEMDTLTGYIGTDERVEIPTAGRKLRTIAQGAFTDKTLITELRIPSSVQTLESGAVSGCTGLEAIYFEGKLPDGFDPDSVTDSGSPVVYLVHGGVALCLGFYADRHSVPLLLSNYKSFERGYNNHILSMKRSSGGTATI